MNSERLRSLVRDLNRIAPRSPYATLSPDFPAVAARLVDKCRADLLKLQGEYHYNCPMDQRFFRAVGLEADALREFVATGADDDEVASWMSANAKTPKEDVVKGGVVSGGIRCGCSWCLKIGSTCASNSNALLRC